MKSKSRLVRWIEAAAFVLRTAFLIGFPLEPFQG
jgi:hypothetical protein